jgi:hypothetical protein
MFGREMGVSFAPTQDNAEESGDRAAREGLPAAIKMLSLRLPRVLGARAPINSQLLNAPGAAGMGEAEQQLFQTLTRILGGGGQLAMPGMQPSAAGGPGGIGAFPGLKTLSAAPPRVIAGSGGGQTPGGTPPPVNPNNPLSQMRRGEIPPLVAGRIGRG